MSSVATFPCLVYTNNRDYVHCGFVETALENVAAQAVSMFLYDLVVESVFPNYDTWGLGEFTGTSVTVNVRIKPS